MDIKTVMRVSSVLCWYIVTNITCSPTGDQLLAGDGGDAKAKRYVLGIDEPELPTIEDSLAAVLMNPMSETEKRGSLMRFGKRQSIFRFGKRGSMFRFGRENGIPEESDPIDLVLRLNPTPTKKDQGFHWGREIQ